MDGRVGFLNGFGGIPIMMCFNALFDMGFLMFFFLGGGGLRGSNPHIFFLFLLFWDSGIQNLRSLGFRPRNENHPRFGSGLAGGRPLNGPLEKTSDCGSGWWIARIYIKV